MQPTAALNEALAANDRIKYCFSTLQLALAYADHPEQSPVTLKRERLACGVDDPALDSAIAGARIVGKACHMSGASQIMTRIAADVRLMAAPVLAVQPGAWGARVDLLLKALSPAVDDLLAPDLVSAMMQAAHDGPDTVHRLVMDLHKRLNSMQADLAEETLDGAAVYGLAEEDRPLVSAFMAGLNRTARLKFNHPGLATTATRHGGQLVIQNDIGTTDAHVIVIHVQDLVVSVTYTDVHGERVTFFQSMLKPQGATWEKESSGALPTGTQFYVATGPDGGERHRRLFRPPRIPRLAPGISH